MKTISARPDTAIVIDPPGRCIYCGASGPDAGLTREHVIPKALKGSLIILKASCKRCTQIIQKVENDNFKGPNSNFGIFRAQTNYPTSRPKERPTHGLISVAVGHGPYRLQKTVPLKDRPLALILPEFGEPGILVGAPIGAPFKGNFIIGHNINSPERKNAGKNVIIEQKFRMMQFMRLLAKIAHGVVVAHIGLDEFEPLLPNLILGNNIKLAGYLVGQSKLVPSIEKMIMANHRKDQRILHIPHIRLLRQEGMLAVGLQLFAHASAPTYCVITGRVKFTSAWLARHGLS